MIAKLIHWCVRNRAMVLVLTAFVAGAGVWAMRHIAVDAIPDLSDVQVIIRTRYPGQAPRIVENHVTYPITTAMLAVPKTKTVRGRSMFGTSFVQVIFEDGTDLYWARSRVLEQLSALAGRLPPGVTPRLGPDATAVGWIYMYVLITGKYCPDHPHGAWRDPQTDRWYADPDQAPEGARSRLMHHRVFRERKVMYADMEGHRYPTIEAAPPEKRDRLEPLIRHTGFEEAENFQRCPLDGQPLKRTDIDLSDLRSIQDWYLRYELVTVEGVSEVAAVGGFVKQYQVVVDPVKLQAYDVTLQEVKRAIKRSNQSVGGRLIEHSETEYMVRGLGYLGALSDKQIAQARAAGRRLEDVRTEEVLEDLRNIALGATEEGEPIYLSQVADIHVGPQIRRGIAEWNGDGEVVGGIVIMRYGENAREVIADVKARLAELERTLPPGMAIETAYDRSDLIDRAIDTLQHTLIEEIVIVSLICIIFLLHARSALVAAFVLPTGVLATLLVMYGLGIHANIMSLGGIAISIGVMVDSSIVMVENAHKHLERERERVAGGAEPRPRVRVIADAAAEVGPSLFFALLIIVVSFLPIFVLSGQSGRLFKPLAYTKSFAMAAGAVLAVTAIPVLMVYFIRERVLPATLSRLKRVLIAVGIIVLPALLLAFIPLPTLGDYRWWVVGGWVVLSGLVTLPQHIPAERRNPVNRLLQAAYHPFFILAMRFRWVLMIGSLGLIALTLIPLSQLGSEFMPPLKEGDLLYMPTTVEPGLSITKAREILQQTDKIIASFPEVKSVFGKIGRAQTATDPAPLNMIETTITLYRDKSKWRHVPIEHFYSDWPDWAAWLPSLFFDESRPITTHELIYGYEGPHGEHVPGLNDALQFPGLVNTWTMPIQTRIDMLATGIKTPVGIKLMGPDLGKLSKMAQKIALQLRTDERTAQFTTSAYADNALGGHYLDIQIHRKQIARYGLTIADVQEVIRSALGGMTITHTIEGLARYPVNVRYPRRLRNTLPALRQTLVATPSGDQVPLGQLASITAHQGPIMIKTENARPTVWVYIDIAGISVGGYVRRAKQVVAEAVDMPTGYSLVWSGQYKYMREAWERLSIALPLTALIIVLLLYFGTRSWIDVAIVLLSLPFALVGAVWLLWFMEYDLSLAVWVGMIALAGLAAETGIVMLLYLHNSFDRFQEEGRMRNAHDLWHAVHEGAVKRIRPKTMTVAAIFAGLLPLLWAEGAGADTMRRLAVPMIGGVATSFILELLLFPVIFYIIKRFALRRRFRGEPASAANASGAPRALAS